MIKRFLKAGIVEKTRKIETIEGTPQGSILSPMLANIYMHYVIALWFEKKIIPNFKGKVTLQYMQMIQCFVFNTNKRQKCL